jgi:class 3 adenylate cyclase/tetratricopeptide (TPR) repeat protein
MKCPKCQSENLQTRKFCRECGTKLVLVCSKCNSENLLIDKFCGHCGHSLGEAAATPVTDYSKPRSYIPRFLADKILTSRGAIEGERKLVTVLFADVANYTSISEKLDPEEVHQLMDGCFKLLMDEIHRYEGTIDKFTGDGIMALFGAPIASEDHAQRACYAALAIQRALTEYGEKVKEECGIEFKMRVGLNSGPVIVGSIGNDLRMDYTAIGDTINLASRMEKLADSGTILVSADTHKMARDFFEFKPLGKLKVKGKEEPAEAYELIQASGIQTRFEAAIVKGLTKFVGREKETEALKEAFEKAQSGYGQVVGVVGEAGVGKSRLLLELRRMLPQGNYTYLEGRCLHYGSSMPYLPILDIIRVYLNIKEGERDFVIKKNVREKIIQLDEKFQDILPPLHELLSLKGDDEKYLSLQPQQRRERIFEAIRDLLIRESQKKPLVLAVEDVHWIDKTSEEFLTYLIDWLANASILLILLYRPEYTHHWGGKSYYSHIGVGQLSAKASAELVQSILEGAQVVPELQELIVSRAGGNPLFVEEFTHTLLENGSIKRKNHEYVLNRKVSEIQVPDTIQGIITARMDRLEDNLKRTMQVAAVIGRDFAYRILHTITGMREELKSYLLNLQGLELIYEKSLFPELEYIFKHALTQEVAYNSLLLKRRKEIHEKIGQAIEQLYGARLEEFYEMLAHHYSRSDNSERAYHFLRLSGDKASHNFSNREAFRFYRDAITTLDREPETEENKKRKVEVLLLITGPMRLLGYPEDSLQILQEGEKLARELNDDRGLANLYSSMSLYYSFQGNPVQGIKYCENCVEEAIKIQDVSLAAPIAQDLCNSYFLSGDPWKIVEAVPKVLSLIEKTQKETEFFGRPLNTYSALHAHCGHAMAMLGRFEEAETLCEKALRSALKVNSVYSMGWAEVNYSYLYMHRGDGQNTVAHAQKAIGYIDEAQALIIRGLARTVLGMGYCFLGNLGTARTYIEQGIELHNNTGMPFLLSLQYYFLSAVHLNSGDLANAQSCAEKALALSQTNKEKHFEGRSWALLGKIVSRASPPQSDRAEEFILRGINILDQLKTRPWCAEGYLYLGELYTETGQREKALEYLNKAKGMFQEMTMNYWLCRTQDVLSRFQS